MDGISKRKWIRSLDEVVERDEERRPKENWYLGVEYYRQRATIEVEERLKGGGVIESSPPPKKKKNFKN